MGKAQHAGPTSNSPIGKSKALYGGEGIISYEAIGNLNEVPYAEPGRRYGSLGSTITRGDITHHGRAAFRKTGKKKTRRKAREYLCGHNRI